jgi:hypothetical protein
MEASQERERARWRADQSRVTTTSDDGTLLCFFAKRVHVFLSVLF